MGVSDIFPLLTSECVVILIIFSSCQTNKLVWLSLLKERNCEVTASFIFLLSHRQQSPPAAAGITITGAPASQNIHQDFIVFFFFQVRAVCLSNQLNPENCFLLDFEDQLSFISGRVLVVCMNLLEQFSISFLYCPWLRALV